MQFSPRLPAVVTAPLSVMITHYVLRTGLIFLKETARYRVLRAHCLALATAYTFSTVDILQYFHRHGAGALAGMTLYAFALIEMHAIQTELRE